MNRIITSIALIVSTFGAAAQGIDATREPPEGIYTVTVYARKAQRLPAVEAASEIAARIRDESAALLAGIYGLTPRREVYTVVVFGRRPGRQVSLESRGELAARIGQDAALHLVPIDGSRSEVASR